TSLDDRVREAVDTIGQAVRDFAPVAFASSLSAEDMVLLDLISASTLDIDVFTLDTGRLNPETHDLLAAAATRYDLPLNIYTPQAGPLERFVGDHGTNAFYDSVEQRQACCEIRKIAPLRRALDGKKSWITGQRRQQSVTRSAIGLSEWDSANALQKFNPLAFWSRTDVWAYIKQHAVPYNRLHDEGYASIGCAPCTRPITVGEDERAGRWWWETPDTKECGLH
ncbi:unnamed protein product, partial [Laminaria digitata]